MKTACYPGSFDPFTNGHLDIALRARKIFDKVYIVIADNPVKKNRYAFDLETRVRMVRESLKDYDGFEVLSTDGLVVKKAKELGCQALIRGLRAMSDYEAEYQLHEVNDYIDPDIDMVFLMSHKEQAFISSSNIKELFYHGEDVSNLVPKPVLEEMEKSRNNK